jgi:hypothetical protein
MTQATEPAKTDKQMNTPVGGGPKAQPKPKPAVASKPAGAPAANAPKPKPALASKPSNTLVGGGPRLTPFDTYNRAGIPSSSGSNVTTESGDWRSKPVAKKRLINIFPGGSPKL